MTRASVLPSPSFEFIRELPRVVNLSERFNNKRRVHGDRAIARFVIDEVTQQTFNVAVENETDEFAVAIDHRRT